MENDLLLRNSKKKFYECTECEKDKNESLLFSILMAILCFNQVHLFDIDIKDVYKFTESSVLTPGNQVTTFEMDGIKCGLAICYDVYFEEFAKLYRIAGVELMFYPAAFNTVIGPLQWELLNRARANDNQFYVITTSPARNPASLYETWGYSMAIDPWARILTQATEHEETLHIVIGNNKYKINLCE